MLRPICLFQILLLAALAIQSESRNTHFHRYMLDTYKPQHNPRTQMDYKRHRTAKAKEHNETDSEVQLGNSKEPMVRLTNSDKRVLLHELMVRIYQKNRYICMGTVISEKLVITTRTCFEDDTNFVVTMKMFDDEIIHGEKVFLNKTFLKGADPMLIVIELKKPPTNSSVKDDTVRLCDAELEVYEPIELPLWIRQRHSIHSQITYVLPTQECRHRMKDPESLVVTSTTICVKNTKYTSTCQPAIGNPLIHDGRICGINVAGHNCPTFTGVDLYIQGI
ncbi:seminase-like [Drosophila eugracilis]|uniref:seminase-like n=1 Tax=Drosophila eugracilis TaxID=29029 RepID=UPI001BDACB6D|nr:seminase-like [Drosophila eugracilis]